MDNYLLEGEMYQYNLGWLIKRLKSLETDLNTAIDLKTIHYADPIQWNITTQYSPNTVVVDPKNGTAYMSKVPVPAGIQLTNTTYWVVVFNYQQIYEEIKDGIASNERSNQFASHDYAVNDLVWWSDNLYRVLKPITSGGLFKPDDNVVKTKIENYLPHYDATTGTLSISGKMTAGTHTDVSNVNFNGTDLNVTDAYAREQIRHLTADNYIADVSGDYTVNAGDITMTSKNTTHHTTADRTIDTDGNDSVHIDGASTLNVGGLRTETFAGDKTEAVTGTSTEKAGNRNTTVTGKWMVNLSDRAFSMQDIALRSDIAKLHKTVKDYGAIGDGVADDSDAIINCINHEGIVYFPAGNYRITKTLTADDKLVIGENKSSTFITMDGNGTLLNAGSRTQIENLTLGFTNADGAGNGEKIALNCMGTKYALQRTSVSNVNIRVCGTAIRSGKEPFFSVNFDTMEITEFTYAAVQIVTPDSTQNAFRNLYVTSTKNPEYMFIAYARMSSIYLENVNLEHTAPMHDPLIIDGCLTARINGIQFEGDTLTESVGLITLNCKNAIISGFTNIFNKLADGATYGIVMHLLKCDGFGTFATSDMKYAPTASSIVINDYTMWGFNFNGKGLTFARRTETDPVVNLYINGFGGVTYGTADLDKYDLFVQADDNTNVFKNVNPGYGAAVPSNKYAGKSELFFDTTDNKMKYFNGTTWVALA